MKISLNWLKDYIDIDVSHDELGHILTDLGLEVEGMEVVESIPGGLKGVVVGEILECHKHPNADRLSVTKVNVGNEVLQIVCGAPNVALGQKVLVSTVGTTLHPIAGEPFEIKKGKIRGEASEGMICAEDELGIGQSHDGIMVLSPEVKVGTEAAIYLGLTSDVVFEIGLTPNRSDATNHLGVARDLMAFFKYHGLSDKDIRTPELAVMEADLPETSLDITVENYEACPRFSGISFSNIQTGPSPQWMQDRLKAVGVRPISNVVDITNYVLHEMGQPLHAYDAEKIKGNKVVVKTLKNGSIFKSLDGIDRKLSDKDLMICDGDGNGMCIGGVFGGAESGVTPATKKIFLEAAHFNAGWIRRSSTRHLLRTDAATIFEKGSDPNNTVRALRRAALLLEKYAGAKIESKIIDIYPNPISPKQIKTAYKLVNRLIGNDIAREDIDRIVKALGMQMVEKDTEYFTVEVPTDKADVQRPEDVIEEILRIYGFNNVILDGNISSSINYSEKIRKPEVRNMIADLLAGKGYNEMMNLSLIPSSKYDQVLPEYQEHFVYINNTSNIHLDIMRPEMALSGLGAMEYNQNRQQQNLRLFEFGKGYQRLGEKIVETEYLSIFMKGLDEEVSWIRPKTQSVDFYNIKRIVDELFARLGIHQYQVSELEDDKRFSYGLKYHKGPKIIAKFGAIGAKVLKSQGLKDDAYYAELEMETVFSLLTKSNFVMSPISKFPSVRRDLALVVDEGIPFEAIQGIVQKTGKNRVKQIGLFDVYKNEEHLGKNKKSYAINVVLEDDERTLRDDEVDGLLKKMIDRFERELGAVIRK